MRGFRGSEVNKVVGAATEVVVGLASGRSCSTCRRYTDAIRVRCLTRVRRWRWLWRLCLNKIHLSHLWRMEAAASFLSPSFRAQIRYELARSSYDAWRGSQTSYGLEEWEEGADDGEVAASILSWADYKTGDVLGACCKTS